jgi:polysaccharide export outer membrane protein
MGNLLKQGHIYTMRSLILGKIGIIIFCLIGFLSLPLYLSAESLPNKKVVLKDAKRLKNVELITSENEVYALINADGKMSPKFFTVGKNKLVVDIPNILNTINLPNAEPPVLEIRTARHLGKIRIVFTLMESTKYKVLTEGSQIRVSFKKPEKKVDEVEVPGLGKKVSEPVQPIGEQVAPKEEAGKTVSEPAKPVIESAVSKEDVGKEIPHVNKDYIIGAEDVLEIMVWGNDDLRRTVEVSQEGDFTFPLIGKVHAGGLSVFELEQKLKERLADGYLVNPQVTIVISKYKSQKVVMMGEVKKVGSYTIKGKTHILELISAAEGLTEAAGSIITVVRPHSSPKSGDPSALGEGKENTTIVIDLNQIKNGGTDEKFFVINGDSVYVNKAPPIFVTGEVNKPGEFKWENGLTVHQAIALAGGATKRGALNRTKITRTENNKEKKIKPGLSDMVMPYDIIDVPESYF